MIGRRGAIATGFAITARAAQAQANWPDHPLRLIVGYPAGGPSDVFARLMATQMGARLGQNVVVENRPGGGAVLASETAARAAPDGYTWMHVDNGILVYNPALYARLPYDPDRDFTGVGFIGRFPLYIVCRADAPWADFAGVAGGQPRRRRRPMAARPSRRRIISRWSWSSAAPGWRRTTCPIAAGRRRCRTCSAGNVDLVMIDTASGLPFIRDGRVRALAVLARRAPPRAGRADHAGDSARRRRLRLAGHQRAEGGAAADHRAAECGGGPRHGRR